MSQLKKHIFLIGFMGVGKTSTARSLSYGFSVREIDTDAMIVSQEGMTIAQIFEQKGEEEFRKIETELLDKIQNMSPCIVSCGGGMAMRQENVDKMKKMGTIIWLTAQPETIYDHVKDSTNRPILNGNMNVGYISELMKKREPFYRKAADIILATDGQTPRMNAEKIEELYRKRLEK